MQQQPLQNIVILGSTGSIGCNTLEVIRSHLDKYKIFALTSYRQSEKLFEQCLEFKPKYALILDKVEAQKLQDKIQSHNLPIVVLSDTKDLISLVTEPKVDIVMSALVGSSGLTPTYHALKAHKKVLLANKESLVSGGKLINNLLKKDNTRVLIPVDSEHSAIFQCLAELRNKPSLTEDNQIEKIILTASGGPFLNFTREEIASVTPEMAIKHPNWSMGKKISVDSSTLMNKGLEVIEAYWLFQTPVEKIKVLIHPRSIIHSMVEYVDGSIMAQLGTADMKIPISYALSFPKRLEATWPKLDLTKHPLEFFEPDYNKFPCLKLAFNALESGGISPTVLNAANEVAVEAFIHHKVRFYQINKIVEESLEYFGNQDYETLEEVLEIDHLARKYAYHLVKSTVN